MQINNQRPFNNKQNLGFTGVRVALGLNHIEKQIKKHFEHIDIITADHNIDVFFRPATTSDLPTAHQVSHLGVVDITDIKGNKLKIDEKPLIFHTKSIQNNKHVNILSLSIDIIKTLLEKAEWGKKTAEKFGKHN